MGNNHSNNKDETVIQSLWKDQRSILVLPINANLEPLRVLTKQTDRYYHDIGNVLTASKPGERRERLKQAVLSPQVFPTKTLGKQPYTISGHQGAVAAKLLVGEANATAWFQNATSINVSVPECSIREFHKNKWDEMIQHFNPDMSIISPGRPEKRDLFVVQKVVLVPQIQITVRYNAPVDLDLELTLPSKGLEIEPSYDRSTDTAKFTILSSRKNQKLPIAFSGFKYTYDKFGVRELKEMQVQHDSTCASSSHEENDDDDEEEDNEDDDEEDDDDVARDENMGDFFEDQDWCTSIISDYDPNENEIYPPLQEEEERDLSPPPSPRQDLEDID